MPSALLLFFWVGISYCCAFRLPGITSLSCSSLRRSIIPTFQLARSTRQVSHTTLSMGIEDYSYDEDDEDDGDGEDKLYIPASMYEVNRKFRLLSRDLTRIKSPIAKGFAGVIISLDTVLTDLTALFAYSYNLLAEDMKWKAPRLSSIRDLVGCTFRDCSIAFGWSIPPEEMLLREQHFFLIVESALAKMSISAQEGAAHLVNGLIDDGNDLVVVTSLPHHLALKVLGKSRVSTLFENRIDPSHLLTYNPPVQSEDSTVHRSDDYGDRFMNKRFLHICALLQKPPVLVALVDGNRRHLLSAKRNSFSAIAISGFSEYEHHLRSADLITHSPAKLRVSDIYKVVVRAAVNADGPQASMSVVMEKVKESAKEKAKRAKEQWARKRELIKKFREKRKAMGGFKPDMLNNTSVDRSELPDTTSTPSVDPHASSRSRVQTEEESVVEEFFDLEDFDTGDEDTGDEDEDSSDHHSYEDSDYGSYEDSGNEWYEGSGHEAYEESDHESNEASDDENYEVRDDESYQQSDHESYEESDQEFFDYDSFDDSNDETHEESDSEVYSEEYEDYA